MSVACSIKGDVDMTVLLTLRASNPALDQGPDPCPIEGPIKRQEENAMLHSSNNDEKINKNFSGLTWFRIINSHKNTNAAKLKTNMPQVLSMCNMLSFTLYQTVIFITTDHNLCTQVTCSIKGHDCGPVLRTLRASFTTTLDWKKRKWDTKFWSPSPLITNYH